ncbi:MAG: hypothetical protein IT292_06385 [Deltaproteobacteria bacterium]|nr:hypothetical protein [Deltaproteobacteria bacterium]
MSVTNSNQKKMQDVAMSRKLTSNILQAQLSALTALVFFTMQPQCIHAERSIYLTEKVDRDQ